MQKIIFCFSNFFGFKKIPQMFIGIAFDFLTIYYKQNYRLAKQLILSLYSVAIITTVVMQLSNIIQQSIVAGLAYRRDF